MQLYQSFPDFIQENEGTVFRVWVYKKMFTPYEKENAFVDESVFENPVGESGVIRQCIPIGNGDFLLGIQLTFDEPAKDTYDMLVFYRLSEIRLEYYRNDQLKEEEIAQ